MMVLLERLKAQMEPHLSEEEAGFREDRCMTHQILILRLMAEKAKRKGRHIINRFIDFQKAFDSIKQDVTWATLKSYGVGARLIKIQQNISEISQSAVQVGIELGDWFKTKVGTRQGAPISPTIFISYLERVMDSLRDNASGISVHESKINNFKFADDIVLLEEDRVELQGNLDRINEVGEAAELQINTEKTMTMVFGQENIEEEMEIRGRSINNFTKFVYLGSLMTWENNCNKEIKRRTIIVIPYIYIALFWVLKALNIEGGDLLVQHQCVASTWMMRRQPLCARTPTTHQLIGGEETEWWSQSVYGDD